MLAADETEEWNTKNSIEAHIRAYTHMHMDTHTHTNKEMTYEYTTPYVLRNIKRVNEMAIFGLVVVPARML